MPSVVLSLLGLGLGALHASSVSAGQVPVVDGVIGGVRTSDSTAKNLEALASDVRSTTPTPGALRVTENSGICGECHPLEGIFRVGSVNDKSQRCYPQRPQRAFIKHQDMVTFPRTKVSGATMFLPYAPTTDTILERMATEH